MEVALDSLCEDLRSTYYDDGLLLHEESSTGLLVLENIAGASHQACGSADTKVHSVDQAARIL